MSIIKQKDIYDDSKRVFDNLNKELDRTTEGTKKLKTEVRGLQTAYKALQKTNDGAEAEKLADATDKLTTSTKKLKKALTDEERIKKKIAVASRNLRESQSKEAQTLAHLRAKTQEQTRALREQAKANLGVKKSTGGLTAAFTNLGKQMIGSFGLIGGVMALVGVMKDAFKIFTEFSKSSSRLAAILGKNKDEIKGLTEQAKELGSVTKFTASEVLGLQTELAKLGFDTTEIEAMTQGVLNLAAATGTDLASSAELVGATLNIFNLSASESARVADVLAKSTSISSLSMEKLATILPTVGKTAQIAGLSLEKTAALAGTLTDRGLDASVAATSLRNIFLELSKKGITWNDAMQQINESTNKNKTAMDLFGKRAATAGIVLSETAASTDDLTIALNKANGAAQEMADTMLDNLAGDIDQAGAAWEAFILSLEDGEGVIASFLRGVVQDFTDFLSGLTLFSTTGFVNQLKLAFNFLIKSTVAVIPGLSTLIKLIDRISGGDLIESITFDVEKPKKNISGINKLFADQIALRDKLSGQVNDEIKDLNEKTPLSEKELKILEKRNKELKKQADFIEGQGRSVREETGGGRRFDLDALPGDIPLPSDESAQRELDFIDEQNTKKLAAEKAFQDKIIALEKKTIADKKQLEKNWQTAKADITAAAFEAGEAILNDIFAAGQEARLAKLEESKEIAKTENEADAESEKEVLRQKLEDGLITETEFKKKTAEIDEELRAKNAKLDLKFRQEQAKADKKAALFSIAVSTAMAIVRQLAATPLPLGLPFIAAIGAIAALQAAVVLAKPLPKFAKGEVDIQGLSHDRGGINANIEGGESVINTTGTSNAPKLLQGINDGLISDSDINMSKNYNNYDRNVLELNGLVSKFDENIRETRQVGEYLKHSYSVHENNGMLHFKNAYGKSYSINKTNKIKE